MYILKNSLKNLVRNKGRNLAVLLIAILTLASVTISFSIQTISNLAIRRYKENFRVDAVIDYDWERAEKDFPPKTIENDDGSITQESTFSLPEISFEDYLKYADSKYVKGAKYYAACGFASDKLTKVPDNTYEGEEWVSIDGMTLDEIMAYFGVSKKEELFDNGIIADEEELQRALDSKRNLVGTLVGYTDLSVVEDFADNANKLKSGCFPEHDNECIVSSKYAEHNKLKIGDTISVSGPSKSDTKTILLTITGIYDAHRLETSAVSLGALYGYVYTTFNTLKSSGFHYIWMGTAVYQLGTPADAELFEKELYEKGLSKYRILSYSNSADEYTKNTGPLKNISRIAEIFTLSVSVIGAAVLLLISFINVRERKYEIGVLRSMGMKKSGIARGMIYEICVLMSISYAAGILAGGILIKPIASVLLDNLTDISISLPLVAIALSAGLAFALSIVSGLCAVFAVMRHEPMKILSERN